MEENTCFTGYTVSRVLPWTSADDLSSWSGPNIVQPRTENEGKSIELRFNMEITTEEKKSDSRSPKICSYVLMSILLQCAGI